MAANPTTSSTVSCESPVQSQIEGLRGQTSDTNQAKSLIRQTHEKMALGESLPCGGHCAISRHALWGRSSVLPPCGRWVNWGRRKSEVRGNVQTFSMDGTRVQRRDGKLSLALSPVRLLGISKPSSMCSFNHTWEVFFWVCHALVKRVMNKQSLYFIRRETLSRSSDKDMQLHKVISSSKENTGQNENW